MSSHYLGHITCSTQQIAVNLFHEIKCPLLFQYICLFPCLGTILHLKCLSVLRSGFAFTHILWFQKLGGFKSNHTALNFSSVLLLLLYCWEFLSTIICILTFSFSLIRIFMET